LHVTQRTAAGFVVQADAATVKAKGKDLATVSGTFSYRIVGKRLAKATLPEMKSGEAPKMTVPPALPKPPVGPKKP
ncbi:MAG: hypothetical protein M3Y58_15450, partial [Chloroflexota bacterium]|nr:hypothetical protein [Chloroflexota bacterium]